MSSAPDARADAVRAAQTEPDARLPVVTAGYQRSPLRIDAKMAKKRVWDDAEGGTGILRDSRGQGMVPYSEARARWDERYLYLWLYAGDLDLQAHVRARDGELSADDTYHIELGSSAAWYALDVSVLGTLSDARCAHAAQEPGPRPQGACELRWQSRARVAVDRDGSLNHIHDNDEEWLVELALPWDSVGIQHARAGMRIPFAVSRCEIGHDGRHACGSFGVGEPRELVLAP